jgi:hypothetical protein
MKPTAAAPFQTLTVTALCSVVWVGSCAKPAEPAPAAATEATGRAVKDVLGATLKRLGVQARAGVISAPELRANVGLLAGDPAEADPASDRLIGGSGGAGEPPAADAHMEEPDVVLDPDLVELREGLIGMVMGNPNQLGTAQKDVAHLKDEIVPVMVAGFAVQGRDPAELKILIDLAVQSPAPGIAVAIAEVAASHDEAWIRRYANWALASLAETPGADQIVPRLIRRLKYERDPETLVWVSSTLATFGNYAGTELLYQTTARAAGDSAGDAARNQLATVLQGAQVALGLEEMPDTPATIAAWEEGRLGRPRQSASDPLLGEVWMLIADLSGEHFQLRGVDDARHTLSSLGPWAASEFALALEDDDEYVRLHTTQVLERMGARGLGAFDSMIAALHDPHDAVCGAAAEALVAVTRGTPKATETRDALIARVDAPCPYEVKVACVRALGRTDAAVIPADKLAAWFQATKFSDLRLAAARGLLAAGRRDDALPWLIEELGPSGMDPAGAEALLGDWIETGALGDELLQSWNSHAAKLSVVHTADQARARRTARAEVLATVKR